MASSLASEVPATYYCLLPTAYCLLPAACYLLPAACYLLPAAYHLLPTAYCPLPTFTAQVLLLWPGQSTLEPSTALFAAYAVQQQGQTRRPGKRQSRPPTARGARMLAHGLLLPLGSRAELHQTTTLSPAVPPWSLSLRGAAQGADVAAPAPANLWPLQVEAGMLVHRAARKVSPNPNPNPNPNPKLNPNSNPNPNPNPDPNPIPEP